MAQQEPMKRHKKVSEENHVKFLDAVTDVIKIDEKIGAVLSKRENMLVNYAQQRKDTRIEALFKEELPQVKESDAAGIAALLLGEFGQQLDAQSQASKYVKTDVLLTLLSGLVDINDQNLNDDISGQTTSRAKVAYFAVEASDYLSYRESFEKERTRFVTERSAALGVANDGKLPQPTGKVKDLMEDLMSACVNVWSGNAVKQDLTINFDLKSLQGKMKSYKTLENLVNIITTKTGVKDGSKGLNAFLKSWFRQLFDSLDGLVHLYSECKTFNITMVTDLIINCLVDEIVPGSRLVVNSDSDDLKVIEKDVNGILFSRGTLIQYAKVMLQPAYVKGESNVREEMASAFSAFDRSLNVLVEESMPFRRIESIKKNIVLSEGRGPINTDRANNIKFSGHRLFYVCEMDTGVVEHEAAKISNFTDRLVTELAGKDSDHGYIVAYKDKNDKLCFRIACEIKIEFVNSLASIISAEFDNSILGGLTTKWVCSKDNFRWKELKCGPWVQMKYIEDFGDDAALKQHNESAEEEKGNEKNNEMTQTSLSIFDWRKYPYFYSEGLRTDAASVKSTNTTIEKWTQSLKRAIAEDGTDVV